MKVKSLSHARLLATPWTVAHQAPPAMGFSRQEYWRELLLPSPSAIINLLASLDEQFRNASNHPEYLVTGKDFGEFGTFQR